MFSITMTLTRNLPNSDHSTLLSHDKFYDTLYPADRNRAGELANRLSTDVHEVAEHLVENVAKFLEGAVKGVSAVRSLSFQTRRALPFARRNERIYLETTFFYFF
jgi:hypothetical protein